MFAYTQKRFNITEEELQRICCSSDSFEVFEDYETMCQQRDELQPNLATQDLNKEIIRELEEEILELLAEYKSDKRP